MDAHKIADRIMHGKDIPDKEWLEMRDEIRQFLKEDHPKEEKEIFAPFGLYEMVTMICDGIERK